METGALQRLYNQKTTQQTKTVEFRPGQIINGKVIKLFPDQVAEVQIGNQKMIAQLEAPLSANERYWFQVQPGEGKVHLKVIGSSAENGNEGSLNKILGEFSMQPTKENLDLIRFFIKEQLPVNRELFLQASEWLKMVDSRSAGLESIKMVLKRGIPVTQATLNALYSAVKEQSFVLLMEQLSSVLDGQPNSTAGASLKSLLTDMLPADKALASQAALSDLTGTWLKSNNYESRAAFELLKQFGAISPKNSESMVLQQIIEHLRNSGPAKDDLPVGVNFVRSVLTSIERGETSAARQIISNYNNEKAFSIDQVVEPLELLLGRNSGKSPIDQAGLQGFKQLLSLVNDSESMSFLLGGKDTWQKAGLELLKAAGNKQTGNMAVLHEKLISEAMNKAEQLVSLRENGAAAVFHSSIKDFLSSMGLSHEHQLAEVLKGPNNNGKVEISDTLKSLLLRLLNENPPQTVKEAAEPLLNKITGYQLLSHEAGPIQQLVVQLPFVLDGRTNELTMQWSGKKTEDGKIDADFCRVLFYLKLEHLDDTIVDMQVQNRVMSIQIINENDALKKMSEELISLLKIKLAEIDYRLSAVHFHLPGQSQPGRSKRTLSDMYGQKEYSGVDIKI